MPSITDVQHSADPHEIPTAIAATTNPPSQLFLPMCAFHALLHQLDLGGCPSANHSGCEGSHDTLIFTEFEAEIQGWFYLVVRMYFSLYRGLDLRINSVSSPHPRLLLKPLPAGTTNLQIPSAWHGYVTDDPPEACPNLLHSRFGTTPPPAVIPGLHL